MAQHRSHLRSPSRRELPAASFEVDLEGRDSRPSGAHRVVKAPHRGRRIAVVTAAAAAVGGLAGLSQFGGPEQVLARLTSATEPAHQLAAVAPAHIGLPTAPSTTSASPSTTSTAPSTTSSTPPSSTSSSGATSTTSSSTVAGTFVRPAEGMFSSGFGSRWGAFHAGVDIANSIGTPIRAVTDGEVIEAGPASGFGLWVRLRHADGTVTVYGHMNTIDVTAGQHVTAGQEIATIGNRGNSTGPHLHFEVWQHGLTKIDPLPWLTARGVQL